MSKVGNKSPTREAEWHRTMVTMSMYVDILTSALDGWGDELNGDALIDYALECRAEMLKVGPKHGDTAYSSLAAEIAYDRALVRLCETKNVTVFATNFSSPRRERSRLERQLASSGIDLTALGRRRPQP
jgi:hypothetical protein